MLHDIIILVAIVIVAYLLAFICYLFLEPERFKNKLEWWWAEGLMIFFLAGVGMVLLALAGHFFHSLR